MIPTPTPDDLAKMYDAGTLNPSVAQRLQAIGLLPLLSPHEKRRREDDAAQARAAAIRLNTPPVVSVRDLLERGGSGVGCIIQEYSFMTTDMRSYEAIADHFERLAKLEPIGFEPAERKPDLDFLERVALGILDYCLAKRQVPNSQTHRVCIHCGKGVTWKGDLDTDGDEVQPGREYFCMLPLKKCPGLDYSGPLCGDCGYLEATGKERPKR